MSRDTSFSLFCRSFLFHKRRCTTSRRQHLRRGEIQASTTRNLMYFLSLLFFGVSLELNHSTRRLYKVSPFLSLINFLFPAYECCCKYSGGSGEEEEEEYSFLKNENGKLAPPPRQREIIRKVCSHIKNKQKQTKKRRGRRRGKKERELKKEN